MKANKKGISLIVLIITIVVIIILAAAIILNLSNTNIIANANKAVTENDKAEMQSAVNLKVADIYAEKLAQPTKDEVLNGYTKDSVTIKGITQEYTDFSTKYELSDTMVVSIKSGT